MSWVGLEDLPVLYAGEVLIQQQAHDVLVTFGQVLPPPILNPEDLKDIEYVPIRPLIRMGISPDKFREIAVAMQAALDNRDKLKNDLDPRAE